MAAAARGLLDAPAGAAVARATRQQSLAARSGLGLFPLGPDDLSRELELDVDHVLLVVLRPGRCIDRRTCDLAIGILEQVVPVLLRDGPEVTDTGRRLKTSLIRILARPPTGAEVSGVGFRRREALDVEHDFARALSIQTVDAQRAAQLLSHGRGVDECIFAFEIEGATVDGDICVREAQL